MTPLLLAQIVLTLFVFVMLLNSAAVMVYVERKVAALLQQRLGPYLVGPKGLLQPIADVIKLMFKEELRPKAADAFLFALAPIISATAAFAAQNRFFTPTLRMRRSTRNSWCTVVGFSKPCSTIPKEVFTRLRCRNRSRKYISIWSAVISASLNFPKTGIRCFNAVTFATCVFSARIGGLE